MYTDPNKKTHYVEGLLSALANKQLVDWLKNARQTTNNEVNSISATEPSSTNGSSLKLEHNYG